MTQALQFILDFGLKSFLRQLVYRKKQKSFTPCFLITNFVCSQFDHLPVPSHLQAFPVILIPYLGA